MTIQQILYAIVIAEKGSINKAAETLYISQPSLTSAIQELEKSIGIRIFNRTGRGVTLTNDGKEFLLYARQVYAQYENLENRYSGNTDIRKKFAVSTQHYSFAVKAYVEMVKKFDTS
ncbi:MAG: LysR family transcriptional regulator, partial [Erysipelotrichaceae bacterium]|nr:LysR family transcriptional regulator [Erysipelotrichaceae bacterium]